MAGEIGGLDVVTEAFELDSGCLEPNFEASLVAGHFFGETSIICSYKGPPRGVEDRGRG